MYTNVTISLVEALTGFEMDIAHLDGHKVRPRVLCVSQIHLQLCAEAWLAQGLVMYRIPSAGAFQANSQGAKMGSLQGVHSVCLTSRLSRQWVVLVLARVQ